MDQVRPGAGLLRLWLRQPQTLVDATRSRDQPVGAKGGAFALVRAIGAPPWWLVTTARREARVRGPDTTGDRALISAGVILVGLVGLLVLAVRRSRTDIAAACSIALTLCAAQAAVAASFPNTGTAVFPLAYASWWAAPAGMFGRGGSRVVRRGPPVAQAAAGAEPEALLRL